ncbi:AfsR/SARP family transcriptional regulator [Phytohabitans houttuyneae]|nr:BTAD domain-containing putative transcriptional regulator [Phytohabitans houttuyneae]
MRFQVLGPVRAWRGTTELDLGSPKQRLLCAVLLLEINRLVTVDAVTGLLWPEGPPRTARRTVQAYVSRLRTALTAGGDAQPEVTLVRRGAGYQLCGEPDTVDAHRFAGLVERARRSGDPEVTARTLREALDLWAGPPLADVLDEEARQRLCHALAETRLAAVEELAEVELSLGRAGRVLAELSTEAAAHPHRQRLTAALMLALHRSGRTAEALRAYEQARHRLADELGVDPSRELRATHLAVLRDGDAPSAVPARTVPALLPAGVVDFTGRAEVLDRLDALAAASPAAAPLVVVTGTAGVGKTALVAHWGGRVRDRFPDGQLYLDLKGFATEPPVRPLDALTQLLRALGVPPDQVPADVREAIDGYRGRLADRRMLVVLDNAASAEQVRPLLPAGPGCLVLVTSRRGLSGLTARDGAYRVHLDVLTGAEALSLLERHLGGERMAAEPAAAAELARVCAGLPLALRIVAANLADRPWESIAAHVEELRTGDRLGKLAVGRDGPAAVRAVFDLSFRLLAPPAQRMFRLLGLAVGADLSAAAAAALAGTDLDHAGGMLDELTDAHLVRQHAAGRYAVHDLLRLYATERVADDETPGERAAAVHRLVWWYERSADAAARLLYPLRLRLPPDSGGVPPVEPVRLADRAAAAAWLQVELANLVRVVTYTAEHGPKAVAWRLADTLRGYFWLCLNTVDWLVVARAALAAAEAEGSAHARAAAWFNLGDVLRRTGRSRQAPEHYERALELAEELDWTAMAAAALGCLGGLYRSAGRPNVAERYLLRALSLARRTDAVRSEAVVLGGLGAGYREMGRVEESIESFSAAVRLFRQSGSREGELATLAGLGTAWHAEGALDVATDHLVQAVAGLREIGDRSSESDALPALAAVQRDRGLLAGADLLATEAISLATRLNDRRAEAAARVVRASIHLHAHRHDRAITEYHLALDLAEDLAEPYLEVEADVGLAEVHAALAATSLASVHARRALARSRACGYPLLRRRAEAVLAALAAGVSR